MASSFWVQTPGLSGESVQERLLQICKRLLDAESSPLSNDRCRAVGDTGSSNTEDMLSCSSATDSLAQEHVALDLPESEVTMSLNSMGLGSGEQDGAVQRNRPHFIRQRVVPWSYDGTGAETPLSPRAQGPVPTECRKCEAYARQCNIAAEQYERTLTRYACVVRELIAGFTSVMTYFPVIRTDHRGDKHLKYIIEAVLGRNDFIADIVALAARRKGVRTCGAESAGDQVVLSMTDALGSQFTDSEALRHTLRLYQTLYVQYIEVWREMSTRVRGDLPLVEFVRLTSSRPGAEGAEPWSEALAYAARVEEKLQLMVPRRVRDPCIADLKAIRPHLITVPMGCKLHVPVRNAVIHLEAIRSRLADHAPQWTADLQQTNLYLDVLADLTLMCDLISLGEISIKSLVYERRMLVAVVHKLSRDVYSLGGEHAAPRCY